MVLKILPQKAPAKRAPRFSAGLLLSVGLLCLPGAWWGYREVQRLVLEPDAVLVLGGATERETFAADFAQQHPDLHIWISGGSNPEYTEAVFADAGIARDRLHIDRTAVDTVTNFTTLADKFKAQGINSVYLVTSDYHMDRARIIGEIVFGSRGIAIKPVSVPSGETPESWLKVARDGARSVIWVITGRTGSTLHPQHFFHD